METISIDKAVQILHQNRISFFNISDARKIFGSKKDNTLYKILQRLEKRDIIKRISNGKYIFSFAEPSEFEVANFLSIPSYISLESALSFYGILSQFPYTVTSITSRKSRKIIYQEKEYEFVHLETKYFFGFLKRDNFLIASPEKAVLDELYLMAKRLRKVPISDLDLSKINRKLLRSMGQSYKFIPLKRLLERIC